MEHLDVLVVGAGLSGIAAGHHLRTTCGWARYAIFEARDAIGGTWDLFRYPGIRSDSDMYTLGYPFRPWTEPVAIAAGDAILRYIRDTAADEGIDRHIRFHHRVVAADWRSEEARWHVTAERGDPGDPAGPVETFELTCSFLFSCTGYYRYDHGHLPDFEGMDRFGGTIVHPQQWPEDLDYEGKEVVVIGSGATAITLVPALAGTAGHVTMLQRSPTYVVAGPRRNGIADLANRWLPPRAAGQVTRWMAALGSQGFYRFCQRFPRLARRVLRRGVERHLPEGYDVDRHFEPSYDPWDQRVCLAPDGDIFRAIRRGEASVVTDRIDTFTEHGLRLVSGEELTADIVITATGLEILFLGGIELSVDGEKVDVAERLAWKGMMLEGVPNLAMAVGYTNASWTLRCDLTCDAVARLLNELRARRLAAATPVNDDESIEDEPLLVLQAGYVRRAVDRLPRQGSRDPWRVRQSYLADYRAMKRSDLVGEGLVLSHPIDAPAAPAHQPSPATSREAT
jgi:cation diffusion facilitator CzcD-associated flavoprotein CzcO